MLREVIGKAMEHSGKILIAVAVVTEICYHAHLFLILMTVGSLMVMIADQIKKK